MLQAAEAVTASLDPARVRQSRRSGTPQARGRLSATFELDPFAVEEALEGCIVPGFEGTIRLTLADVREAPVLVMLGAPGVYRDGFKVISAPRTGHLNETELAAAHAIVKARLIEAGLVLSVPDSVHANVRPGLQTHNLPTSARALLDSTALSSRTAMTIMNDTALQTEQEWIVPGYIPPGLTILAGAPKLGKSWLVLQAAVAVARGSLCLGTEEECEAGNVLYLSLEDSDKRLHRRLKTVAETTEGMDRLHIMSLTTGFSKLDEGGLQWINEWCDYVENPRLIIVDTLARVRPATAKGQSAYEADYACIASLQKIASERGLAVVVVHHTRKAAASDPFDCVSGTLGISGAADATMVMRKKGERGPVTLYARGRDIEEFEVGLQFDPEFCRWEVADAEARDDGHNDHNAPRSPERTAIVDALMSSTAAAPMTTGDVVTITGMPSQNVRKLLSKMVAAREILKVSRGKYVLPSKEDANAPAADHFADHKTSPVAYGLFSK